MCMKGPRPAIRREDWITDTKRQFGSGADPFIYQYGVDRLTGDVHTRLVRQDGSEVILPIPTNDELTLKTYPKLVERSAEIQKSIKNAELKPTFLDGFKKLFRS